MFPPFLIQIIVVLLIVGLLLWILQQIPGIDPAIIRIIRVVIIVCVVIWLIYLLSGLLGGVGPYPLRR
jgi:hypothetical protein